MKNILLSFALCLTLLALAACGGGSSPTTTTTTTPPAAKTTASLTINLTGTLPAGTAISGADFTLTLPANVMPANTNGTVNAGVVTYTVTFAGSTIQPYVDYTAATAGTPGKLRVILTNSVAAGVTQVGEVATITLQLANSATPAVGSFVMSTDKVIDVPGYTIGGMNVSVVSVTLQ